MENGSITQQHIRSFDGVEDDDDSSPGTSRRHGTSDGRRNQGARYCQGVPSRQDSEFSVDSDYSLGSQKEEESLSSHLNAWQGAALLTADCMGTGLLALPGDIRVLGYGLGLSFLIANLPLNFYAGTLIHWSASAVEEQQAEENRVYATEQQQQEGTDDTTTNMQECAPAVAQDGTSSTDPSSGDLEDIHNNANTRKGAYESVITTQSNTTVTSKKETDETTDGRRDGVFRVSTTTRHAKLHHDTATKDYIGLTQALFHNKTATRWIVLFYYTNLFLVLGNYILVMSHAVSAMLASEEGELCLPFAGLIASTLMFAVSQFRTMAKLGRSATILSLVALFIVVIQCLWHHRNNNAGDSSPDYEISDASEQSLLRKFSAVGSIGFAVGSQKLFLNIRHELRDRSVASKSLGVSLTGFGTFYILIILAAGSTPPSFLFDAIPPGSWNRRVAGFLLWGHVAVSYAINSQAICSSLDRLIWHRFRLPGIQQSPARRWLILTVLMQITAYTVANAIPFFKDLVALIGSLTSVPLTLLLPAIFWRRRLEVSLFLPTRGTRWSSGLLYFSFAFMFLATAGSLYSIQKDWSNHGAPFSCH